MRKNISLWSAGFTSLALLGLACAADETSQLGEGGGPGQGSGASSAGGSDTTNTTSSLGGFTVGTGGTIGQGGSCVDLEFEGEAIIKPADIIIVIDNSGTMSDEISGVEQNINVNFAQILAASAVDYQVVMVTNHGTGAWDVCIGAPLSNSANCNGPPGDVPGQFHHYDIDVQSLDSACIMLDTLYGTNSGGEADEHDLHPDGWSKWLRTEAVKVFVEITDDRMSCTWNGTQFNDGNDTSNSSTGQAATAALAFDQELLAAAPAQFGSVSDRNYIFHSITGVAEKANPAEAYQPSEPIVATDCPSAINTGPGYQWLSKGTQGLRFPVCNYQSYDAVFQNIAAGVVEGAAVPCEFAIPDPGNGQTLDLTTLLIEYTPSMGSPELFEYLSSAAACGMNDAAFYIEDDTIKLCPAACSEVTGDNDAGIKVIAQCGGTID